jgi:hypothetical protein
MQARRKYMGIRMLTDNEIMRAGGDSLESKPWTRTLEEIALGVSSTKREEGEYHGNAKS